MTTVQPANPGTAGTLAATGYASAFSAGVSWKAIFAGAVAACALSLILVILGSGLGFTMISPWANDGASAQTVALSTIGWLTFTQLAASGIGGYLAGRLRTRWTDTQVDEIYFRDTAHGFLAWGVATLATAALLTSTISAIVSTGAQAGAAVAQGAALSAGAAAAGNTSLPDRQPDMAGDDSVAYSVDMLLRRAPPAPATANAPRQPATGADAANAPAPVAEVGRILQRSLKSETLDSEDSRYLAQLVAQRTGVSQQEAEKRVNDVYAKAKAEIQQAKETADKARKAAAYSALWTFIALLIGAFTASWMATFGGRQRDL